MGIDLKTKKGNITLTAPKSTGGTVDLTNYYTKSQTDERIDEKITIELDGYALKSYVDELYGNIEIPEVDLTGYATEDFVNEAVSKVEIPDVSNFITEIPEEYVTESELDSKGYLTEHQSLEGYAKTEDIPSLEGYAKTTDIPDVSEFITEEDLPDVSGFQTEEQVNTLISNALAEIGVAEQGAY